MAPCAELAEVARRLDACLDLQGATVIKTGDRRSVWSLPEVAGGLLVKRFEIRGTERVKYALLASRARSEYRAMEAFVRVGLPVVRPLGYGERRRRGLLLEAWFVGRLVQRARTLAQALDDARRLQGDEAAFGLARAALDVVAELHDHPWLHRDLHAGNLLVDPAGHLLVTDLHSVWRVPRLTRRQRIENLARLIFSMRGAIDLVRAPALVRGYALRRQEDAEDLVRDVRGRLSAFEARYRRGRVARCLRTTSVFVAERVPEGRLFRRRGYAPELLRDDLRSHAESLAGGGSRVLGQAPRSRVTLVGKAPGERVVKEYRPPGAIASARQLLGRGRARTAWVGARWLELLDITTPEALALLERHDGTAVLVTRALTDARQLRSLAPELVREARSLRRAGIALALGHLFGRLARAGLRHDDLSAKNVFVQAGPASPARDLRDRAPDGAANLLLIDLDGLKRMPPFDPRGLVRMLEQLADLPVRPSRADRWRFSRAYALAAGRELPREIAEQALAGAAARAATRARAGGQAGAARPGI